MGYNILINSRFYLVQISSKRVYESHAIIYDTVTYKTKTYQSPATLRIWSTLSTKDAPWALYYKLWHNLVTREPMALWNEVFPVMPGLVIAVSSIIYRGQELNVDDRSIVSQRPRIRNSPNNSEENKTIINALFCNNKSSPNSAVQAKQNDKIHNAMIAMVTFLYWSFKWSFWLLMDIVTLSSCIKSEKGFRKQFKTVHEHKWNFLWTTAIEGIERENYICSCETLIGNNR